MLKGILLIIVVACIAINLWGLWQADLKYRWQDLIMRIKKPQFIPTKCHFWLVAIDKNGKIISKFDCILGIDLALLSWQSIITVQNVFREQAWDEALAKEIAPLSGMTNLIFVTQEKYHSLFIGDYLNIKR